MSAIVAGLTVEVVPAAVPGVKPAKPYSILYEVASELPVQEISALPVVIFEAVKSVGGGHEGQVAVRLSEAVMSARPGLATVVPTTSTIL